MQNLLKGITQINAQTINYLFKMEINPRSSKLNKLLHLIDTTRDFKQVEKIVRINFPDARIRKGSSRMVVNLCETRVLKVAYNEKGLYQNETENYVSISIPVYYRRFLAKIIKVSPNNSWVIQERVKLKKGRCSDFILCQHNLRNILYNQFDVADGDLNQVGKIGNRTVLYDYGLTESIFCTYYRGR